MFDILSDIITGPNPMIWVLFFYLLFINLQARKNYTVDFNKAIITSILFIAGALYNFFYDKINLSLSYVVLVVCILLLAILLSFNFSKSEIYNQKSNKSLQIKGSFVPFFIFLIFFIIKFIFGFLKATSLNSITKYLFLETIIDCLFFGYNIGKNLYYTQILYKNYPELERK